MYNLNKDKYVKMSTMVCSEALLDSRFILPSHIRDYRERGIFIRLL